MTNVIDHRGPDGEGFFLSRSNYGNYIIGLGHRRLSIIDLVAGHQPICNEDGSIQIVFNGEIYNYQLLRVELAERGHRFRTNSDTETIVHAYEEYGEDCVEHFRGMFAFAIWDANKDRLFLARDRFGKKPLFVWQQDDRLLFASEIKSLLASGYIDVDVDLDADRMTMAVSLEARMPPNRCHLMHPTCNRSRKNQECRTHGSCPGRKRSEGFQVRGQHVS